MKTKLQLTFPWMMAIMLLFSFNSHGQGFENFDNLDLTGNSYQDGTFEGQDGSTWTYVQCRGDHEIDGNAIMLGRNRDPQSNFYSGTIPGGVGVISFDYMQAFSTDVNMNVLINDVVVGNVTSDDEQGVVKSSGDIVVNQAGDIVIKFINENNSDGQVVVDNVDWTAFDGPVSPSISNVNQTPETDITSDTGVSVSADVSEGDAAVDHVELHWGTESDVYNNTINMSLDNDVTYDTDADVPPQADGTTVYYVVYAEDTNGENTTSMEHSYTVIDPAVTDLPFEESFDEDLGDLYTYSVSGDTKYWMHDTSDERGYAYMNGFNSGDLEDDWLVLPGIEMEAYTDVVLTFETAYNFGSMDDDNYLKLFYSEDYAGIGDPGDATWVELDFDLPDEGGYEWTPSGNVAIPESDNMVYIAFQYYYQPGEYRAWQVDNIQMEGEEDIFVVTEFPWFEGFEEEWEGDPEAPENWTVVNGVEGSYWEQHGNSYTGDHSARSYQGFASDNQADEWLITPPLNLDNPEAIQLLFYGYSHMEPDGVRENMRIMIMDEGYDNVADLHEHATEIAVVPFSEDWEEYIVSLEDYDGVKHLAFNYHITEEMDASFNWTYVDDVTVGEFDTFTLTMLSPDGDGSVMPEVGTHDFTEDTEVSLSAEADYTWEFDKWEVNGEFYSNEADTTLVIDEDKDVQAFFLALDSFTLTMEDPDGEGSVDPEPGDHTYLEDDEVDLTATPDNTWEFDRWEVNGDFYSNEADTIITMNEDKDVQAVFLALDSHTLTMEDPDGEGSVTPEPGDHLYLLNDTVALTASPDMGWEFDHWVGDVEDEHSAATTIVMDDDKTVKAVFEVFEAIELPFAEDFTGVPAGEIPPNWTSDAANWAVTNSNNAGGEAPEMHFNWSPSADGAFYLTSPNIDTEGETELLLTFKHSVNNFSAPGDYTLKVLAIADDTEYLIHEWVDPDDIDPEELQVIVTADDHGVGTDEFYLAWVFDGDSYDINQWYIDDIHMGEVPDMYEVTFDVMDEDGDAITDAVVTLGDETNEAGDYVFTNVIEGNYDYTVQKEGYLTYDDEVFVDDDITVEVTLEMEEVDPEEVATLAELRDKPDDGTIYHYTGDAVIVAMDDHRNRKFLQDETAAIMIDDDPGTIETEYDLYDVITDVIGQISIFNNMVQFQPTEDAPEAVDNTPVDPTVFMLDEVTSDDQAKLLQFNDVHFVGIEEDDVFENGTNYTISDGEEEFVVRTDFWNVDYIGEPIPQTDVDIAGVIIQWNETLQLVPRFDDDIEEAVETHAVTFQVDLTYALMYGPLEDFDPDNHHITITGEMIGWAEPGDDPDNQMMEMIDDDPLTYEITYEIEAGTYEYKYFSDYIGEGWDGGEWEGGDNRFVEVTGEMVVEDFFGYLDDELPAPEEVATLAELRDMPDDGTIYHYTGDAVITAMADFGNQKFLQDETAAILIWDWDGIIETDYQLYDVITDLQGTINDYFGMIQFVPDANTSPAEENNPIEPEVVAFGDVDQPDDQAKLLKFEEVTFTHVDAGDQDDYDWVGIEEGDMFENGTNYLITDGDTDFIVRSDFHDVDYIGEEIPHDPVHISGVIKYDWGELKLIPRFEDDIEEAVEPDTYAVTFQADLTYALMYGPLMDFDADEHHITITGEMLGWAEPGDDPDNQVMEMIGDDPLTYEITHELEAGTYEYKYFSDYIGEDWDGGEWEGGDNRIVEVTGDMLVEDFFGYTDDEVSTQPLDEVTLNIFPNPASSMVTIESDARINDIRMVDVLGQVVYTGTVNDTRYEINVGSMQAGVYFVQLTTEAGVVTHRVQVTR